MLDTFDGRSVRYYTNTMCDSGFVVGKNGSFVLESREKLDKSDHLHRVLLTSDR